MIICESHKILRKNVCVAVLNVYLESSGNPSDGHKIVGVSVDGKSIGETPFYDKFEDSYNM